MPRTKPKQLNTLPRDTQFTLNGRRYLVVWHWPDGTDVVALVGWDPVRRLPADTTVRVAA